MKATNSFHTKQRNSTFMSRKSASFSSSISSKSLRKSSSAFKNFQVKSTVKVDVSRYILSFDAVFENQDLGEAFLGYLQTEFNAEPLLFLQEVLKLKEMDSDEYTEITEQIEAVKEIVIKFIIDNAKYEVNISGKMKSSILQDFEKQKDKEEWVLTKTPYQMFSKVAKIVQEELYHDNWKRFIRSEEAGNIIQKYNQDPSGLNDLLIF
jgi:hypothetical protein